MRSLTYEFYGMGENGEEKTVLSERSKYVITIIQIFITEFMRPICCASQFLNQVGFQE